MKKILIILLLMLCITGCDEEVKENEKETNNNENVEIKEEISHEGVINLNDEVYLEIGAEGSFRSITPDCAEYALNTYDRQHIDAVMYLESSLYYGKPKLCISKNLDKQVVEKIKSMPLMHYIGTSIENTPAISYEIMKVRSIRLLGVDFIKYDHIPDKEIRKKTEEKIVGAYERTKTALIRQLEDKGYPLETKEDYYLENYHLDGALYTGEAGTNGYEDENGEWQFITLNEELCDEYNLICDRW